MKKHGKSITDRKLTEENFDEKSIMLRSVAIFLFPQTARPSLT